MVSVWRTDIKDVLPADTTNVFYSSGCFILVWSGSQCAPTTPFCRSSCSSCSRRHPTTLGSGCMHGDPFTSEKPKWNPRTKSLNFHIWSACEFFFCFFSVWERWRIDCGMQSSNTGGQGGPAHWNGVVLRVGFGLPGRLSKIELIQIMTPPTMGFSQMGAQHWASLE
jgi:hypothetical protein